MQTTHKISGADAQGFATYLTSTSARGDYYLGSESGGDGHPADGSPPNAEGIWHGSPQALAALGLSADQPVERDQLLALMNGLSPATGEPIRQVGGDGSRVAGIDLTFSAPKSVSALWAVSSPYHQAQIETAHRAAVATALGHIERDVELVRTRVNGELKWHRAESLIAAQFMHTSSRLTRGQEHGGVPDPQLHSHVVVLAAQRMDGRFAAVDSRELFRSARGNGAWYRAELAQSLQTLGLEVEGQTGRDGRYFELAGVPKDLTERWSSRSADINRAAREFRTRYGRDPKAGELGSLTVGTRGTKSIVAPVQVKAAWQAVASEYGLTAEQATELFAANDLTAQPQEPRDLASELLKDAVKNRSMISGRDLHARAYELAAGHCSPAQARETVTLLEREGELIRLEGGMWTTRELREQELQTLATVQSRAGEPVAQVDQDALQDAERQARRDLGAPLSEEQKQALRTITGEGGVSVLVGQAGTGKGVVIRTAAHAWRQAGYNVIGTAIAGATAERLAADAQFEHSFTTDSLLARADHGSLNLNKSDVVVMDEAGMADTKRLAKVVELTNKSQSKLLLVGDAAQLSPIGAGGLFEEIQDQAPSAELTEVHRAQNEWERQAWAQVREGESHRALAQYQAHDRLHITDTRQQAAEQMIQAWDKARLNTPEGRSVMLTDASNNELDKINALAQERRAQNGELGQDKLPLQDRPYELVAGDQIIFTAAYRQPGAQSVENGTLGMILGIASNGEQNAQPDADPRTGELTIQTKDPNEREIKLNTQDFQDLKLAYAQHVYKAQGLTVDQSFVLMGGWQTDRERAYVALTRAREETNVYLSREDLGEQDLDTGAIERLGENVGQSNAQEASVTREPEKLESECDAQSEVGRVMEEQRERERDRRHGLEP